jgi:hypothetical protein
METLVGAEMIKGLSADGPDPELKEKLMLFGQFVGDWDILEDRFFRQDGTEFVQSGELHWGWILDGRAVQDVWMFRDEDTKRLIPAGTTVRFYDPEIDAWQSTWITPLDRVVKKFIGRKVGGEIVLERYGNEGNPLKWIFSEIKRDSFRWRSEESKDGGKTWMVDEEMRIRRKN